MAVGDANVFLGFLTPVLKQLFFPKPPTTFLTCFCRGERRKNRPERKVASTGDQTHNHQVMSSTRSPLSHPGGAKGQVNGQLAFVYSTKQIYENLFISEVENISSRRVN